MLKIKKQVEKNFKEILNIDNIQVGVIDDNHYELLNVRNVVNNNKTKPLIVTIDENECWNCLSHYSNDQRGGYVYVSVEKGRHERLHKIVLEKKLQRKLIPKQEITRHICDNPKCCNPKHLIVGTHQDNVDDMIERGRACFQQDNYEDIMFKKHNSIGRDIVIKIAEDFINGEHTYSKLDKKYNVSRNTSSNIVHRNIYPNFTKDYDFESVLKEIEKEKEQLIIDILSFKNMGYTNLEIANFLKTNRETVRSIINNCWEIKHDDIKSLNLKVKSEPFVYIKNILECSMADGTGVRTVVFFSYCDIKCEGCHNKETTWDLKSGNCIKVSELAKILIDSPFDITLSGGECLCQYKGVELLLNLIKSQTNKNIWVYSGRTFEYLSKELGEHKKLKYGECLKNIDVLVDGRYIKDERNTTLAFRGSNNQRIIDVQKSLKKNKVITLDK